MGMQLEIGLSKKLGMPNFGSKGASVSLTIPADVVLLERPEELRRRIASLFASARQAVERELASTDRPPDDRLEGGASAASSEAPQEWEPSETRLPPPASDRQVRALHAICRRTGRNVYRICQERFGLARPQELDAGQASQLIDELDRHGVGVS